MFPLVYRKLKQVEHRCKLRYDIKDATSSRSIARLFESLDDDFFHVRVDHENQMVCVGGRFLLSYLLR